MPDSPIHALTYPTQIAAGAGPDVPADIKALVDDLDTKLTPFSKGLIAARPAFGKAGQRYFATDELVVYLDIGTAWVRESPAGTDAAAAAGVRALRSLGAGALDAAAGNDARLSDQRVPTDGSVTAAKIADALKPSAGAAAATEALRALGAAAGTAAAGNDARLSDQRVPTDGSVSYAKLAAAVAALLPSGVVNALPGAPVDGQTINYQTAAMAAQDIVWRLRYRDAVGRWECIGGGFLRGSGGGAAFVGLGGGFSYSPQLLAVPRGGDYETWVYGEVTETNISFASVLFGVGADNTATIYREMGTAPVVDDVAMPVSGFRSDCTWAAAAQLRAFLASPGWVMNGSHGAWVIGIRPSWIS